MAELLPRSIHASDGALRPAVAVTEEAFKIDLGGAIRVLRAFPLTAHDIPQSQTLFGRVACYDTRRPNGANWIARGVMDYDPHRCESVSAASDASHVGPLRTITFFVHDENMQSHIPPGTVVRFYVRKKSRPSHRCAHVVVLSAVNVAPA